MSQKIDNFIFTRQKIKTCQVQDLIDHFIQELRNVTDNLYSNRQRHFPHHMGTPQE